MPADDVIDLPRPLAHQDPIASSPARFKVVRAGRRFGKDRVAFTCSIVGHGPDYSLPGLMHGLDVVWLAPDFPQATQIWTEEIRPRFGNHDRVKLNENDKTLTLVGGGTLWLKSNENIRSIRGIGKKLAGVVINEAAWFDLGYAWRSVLRPALMDNEGWAIIMSTTNSGLDGNAEKRVPSYFNTICQEILDGCRGPEWEHFYGTARDNPIIDPAEIRDLETEYGTDLVAKQQEIDALLLESHAGLVFSEWRPELHVVSYFRVPRHWSWAAGMDWGYRAPGAFVLFAMSPEGDVVGVDEYYFNAGSTKQHAKSVGFDVGNLLRQYPPCEYIAADEQMWYKTGVSAPNLAEEFTAGLVAAYGGNIELAPAVVEATHGRGSRRTKLQLVHRYMGWRAVAKGERGYAELKDKRATLQLADGRRVPAWGRPLLRFTDLCKSCIRTIPKLPYDPKGADDVDTTAEDHAYDAVGGFLMSRPRLPDAIHQPLEQDRHPGFSKASKKRRHPEAMPELSEGGKPWLPGRFRMPRMVEAADVEEG